MEVNEYDLNLSVIILAGGKSSRFGNNKALIEFDNQPLIVKIFNVAQNISNSIYVVSFDNHIYQRLLPSSCHFIQEKEQFSSPLVAFADALPFIKTPWVLLLACDLPLLSATEIQLWVNDLNKVDDLAIATLPPNEKGWEVLCGFYRQNCLSSLQHFIERGGKSFQQWLKNHLVTPLAVKDKSVLFNCNTLDDFNFCCNFIADCH